MAKDKRIVAGVISDTKYYYASDGSVVDEDGKPAPAKFAAMFPPMPEQKPEPVKETKPKKTRRKLKDLAGRIKNSKYYYDKEGNVVDEEGKPVNEKLAGYFGKREELRKEIPKVEPKKQTDMIDGKRLRVINSEIGKAIRSTQNLVQSNEIIQDKMTTMFDSFNDVVKTLGDQNDAIVQRLIQQNQEFQDKVIETLSGVPGATKAGGAKPKKINPRAVGGSKAARGTELKVKTTNYRETRKQEVEDRARNIAAIKTKRDIKSIVVGSLIGATAGVGAGALISAITPSTTAPSTPTPPGGAPGGTTPSGPGGGNGDTTPGSGGMTRLKTKDGYPYEVDSKFAANFKGFVDELEASGYKIKRGGIGGYSPRPGWHGKGMAIDINPDDNPMLINSGGRIINKLTGRESSDLRNSKYPFGYGKDNFGSLDVGAMARKWGLGWGGNWKSSSDTMHFSAGSNEGGTGVVPEGGPQVAVNGGAAPGSPTGGIAPAPAPPGTGTGGVGTTQAPGAGSISAGTSGAGAAPGTIARINEVGPGYNVVQLGDGSVERRAGARNWRNNNPGNIEYGSFSKSAGAIGSDGRFAIFPSYEVGRAAKEKLLFEGRSYSGMSIQQAIYKYAPPSENNSAAYAANVAAAAGVSPSTTLTALNADQRKAMLNAMEKVEGFRSGKITKVSEGNTQVASAGAPPKAYAAGDPYVPNTGPAIVGERGPELVIGQDGSSRLTGQGPRIENLNKGDSVIPADKTKKMLPAYAGGTSELMLDSDWQPHIDKEKHARYMGGRPDTMSDDERNEYEGFKTKKQYGDKDSLWNQKVAHPNAEAAAQGYTADRGDAEEWDVQARLQRGERVDPDNPPGTMTKRELASRIQQYGMPGLASGAYSAEEFQRITRAAGQFQWQTDAEDKYRAAQQAKKQPGPVKPLQAYADGTKPPKKTGKPIKAKEPEDKTAEIGLSLLKTGVSFIPGVGQVVAGLDAANELRKGNIGGALKAGLGAIPGGGAAMGVGKMVAGEAIDQIGSRLTSGSEQNAMQEYTKPPAVKTVIVNNNRTNNVTKTVNQGSSLPKLDRNESANPLVQGGNKRTAMGAF